MKPTSLVTITNHEVDSCIQKEDAELTESTLNDARHFAKRNLPAPVGDDLSHYIAWLKTRCEKLAAKVSRLLLAAAHFPEAKMDHDFFKDKVENINSEIKNMEEENQNDERSLGSFNPIAVYTRIRWLVIINLILIVGEIIFNSEAFQVIGGNLLVSLAFSISVSVGILLLSHFAASLYKGAKTVIRKRIVIAVFLPFVTILFIALANFRSQYLGSQDIHINPLYFVIINLLFFMVTAFLSLHVPTKEEIKEHAHLLKLHKSILKRRQEIDRRKEELEKLKLDIVETTKHRARVVHLANYYANEIRKIYWEKVGLFITTNLAYRKDRRTSDSFSQTLPEPDIEDFTFNFISTNRNK